ncbi:MAG: 3-oxoacid CoA-transferase subunit B [Actinobacteria bacterium]|nr:3-oxoacid CoA-transferase subunit B [Actinomycetota bacterium]
MLKESDKRARIAKRAAQELRPGDIVNLGIGIPTLVPDFLPPDVQVHFHTENGMLGVGPLLDPEHPEPNLVNAGKQSVGELPGASYFDSASSFAMIRGGHVDVAILGAIQVGGNGDIANWAIPGQDVLGVDGAMDLVVGARKVIVTMLHTARNGEAKIVRECTVPVTGKGQADMIITDLAVFILRDGWIVLEEIAPGTTPEEVKRLTGAPFQMSPNLRYMDSGELVKGEIA